MANTIVISRHAD